MEEKELKVLFSKEQIDNRIKELAQEINQHYKGIDNVLCVCVLKGAALFFADLVRQIKVDNLMLDFITLSSYGMGKVSQGSVDLKCEPIDVSGKHVLVVEDIVDSGLTLQFIHKYMANKGVKSLKVACLLDKPAARIVDVAADFIAFKLKGKEFVVGYGLDLNQQYRNLDSVYEID